ncbi:MAG: sulfate permease [Deltaproteobacteria bacterium]|nr:MAG: sulfate permease [Deltaproteobacteria bacterium]
MTALSTTRLPQPEDLRGDLVASLVVAAMFVPQAMAYGLLAGLSPVHGLYTAVVPVLVYAVFGRSRFMAVGPVAITALLVATGLERLGPLDPATYERYARTLALLVGLAWVILAVLRAGFLVNFIGTPVIVGFNAAAALVTAGSQLRPLLGIDPAVAPGASSSNPWPYLLHLDAAHPVTAIVGVAAAAFLVVAGRLRPTWPGPLVVCVAGGLVAWALDLASTGLAVVGVVPKGLPPVGAPSFDLDVWRALAPTAASIAVVGYASSITVVKALAAKERESVQPNAELAALGLANVGGSFFGAFPASAGLSRSAVVARAGARTKATMFLAGLWVLASLLWLAPIFHHLPTAVLAAIIAVSVARLFDVRKAITITRTKATDGLTVAATFAATLGLGLVEGLAVGIVLALLVFVGRSAMPHSAELGRIPGTEVYRNVLRYDVETCPQVAILRVDAPLYFANARFLEDRIDRLVATRPDVRIVALECSSVGDMDATAVEALERLVVELRERGVDLDLVGPIGPVRDILQRSGLWDVIGPAKIHRTILEAAPLWMRRIDRRYCTERCTRRAFPDCDEIPRRTADAPPPKARYMPEI